MKLASCVLVLQALLLYSAVQSRLKPSTATSGTYNPKVYETALKIIEHLMVVQDAHAFECIFYDISTENSFDVVLGDLLRSPRLEHALKYVVQGFGYCEYRYPTKPSLLLMHTGTGKELDPNNISAHRFFKLLRYFNPTTSVIVITDFRRHAAETIFRLLARLNYQRVTYINTNTGWLMLASELTHTNPDLILDNPAAIEMWHKQALRRRNIIYIPYNDSTEGQIALEWVKATAKYMNVGAVKYNENTHLKDFDVDLMQQLISYVASGHYRVVFATALEICQIVIPKERPLNAAEIMMVPFNWEVWTLLFIILAASEIANRLLPGLFSNDPILCVVCGFERHNLHQATRREKIILISLIILMFFMTNAFETKVISLMTSKPSLQHVKSLADFDKYDIKFSYNLKENPDAARNPVIGKYVIHHDKEAARLATYWIRSRARRFKHHPMVVVLDEEYFDGVLGYRVQHRSLYVEVLQFTLVALDEAGLWDLWRRRYENLYFGRHTFYEKSFLNFEDMLPAWMVLGIGLGVGFVGFIGELWIWRYGQAVQSKAVKFVQWFRRSLWNFGQRSISLLKRLF